MKAGALAIAAALAIGASASKHNAARRHAHAELHERAVYPTAASLYPTAPAAEETCGCTTIYSTFTGEGVLYFPPAPTIYAINSTSSVAPSPHPTTSTLPTTSKVYVATEYPSPVVPTPMATTCPTPGVYTIPATTVTLTESTTVCAPTSTYIPAGNHTAGGVTTIVKTKTTVVCPYAAIKTNSGGVVTSTILTTTYVCPSAGTYTIAPLTTSVPTPIVWVYPTPAVYNPGTYVQSEVVTTITEINVVVFCPYTSSKAPVPVPTYVAPPVVVKPSIPEAPVYTYVAPPVVVKPSTPEAPVPVYTYVAPPVVVKPSTPEAPVPVSTYVAPPVVVKPAPSSSSAKSTPTASPNPGGLGTSGKQWAMTYSPYKDNGECKNAASVSSDIATIAKAGFTTVRVYSSDCSGLENIGAACEANGIKMILGIFISSTGISGAAEQLTDIVSWGKWNLVELVVVGNEAIFNGYCSAAELAAFILSCKAAMGPGGYTGPITTTETLDVWQKNAASLCPAVDVVGCNIHPFFNPEVDAGSAGEFTASQLKIVDEICPGKSGVNLETGWPSSGSCNGKACPGVSEQATAIKGISAACGGRSVMFSYVNDLWKEPGAFNCEQSWGSIHNFE
ncbi:hypothetical protein LZ554_002627 [Drepanopeziza brunnea f. sp. 'monogermtubi']|nr:hypothetical protein LZ554_002627 [Drepanopeziza brunnea f. sp. 'monogermtubi']